MRIQLSIRNEGSEDLRVTERREIEANIQVVEQLTRSRKRRVRHYIH